MKLSRKEGGFIMLMVLGLGTILFLLLSTVILSAASFQKSNKAAMDRVQERANALELTITE
jgi:hypothetical protein